MKITFYLGWAKGNISKKAFKSEEAFQMFSDYFSRLGHFTSCQVTGAADPRKIASGGTKLWVCSSSKNGKHASSEEVAAQLKKLLDAGTKELCIAVGPADGFSKETLENLKPDFLWSFGPMTLPHELAAVVASEQLYRAFTILRNLPYHSGH